MVPPHPFWTFWLMCKSKVPRAQGVVEGLSHAPAGRCILNPYSSRVSSIPTFAKLISYVHSIRGTRTFY